MPHLSFFCPPIIPHNYSVSTKDKLQHHKEQFPSWMQAPWKQQMGGECEWLAQLQEHVAHNCANAKCWKHFCFFTTAVLSSTYSRATVRKAWYGDLWFTNQLVFVHSNQFVPYSIIWKLYVLSVISPCKSFADYCDISLKLCRGRAPQNCCILNSNFILKGTPLAFWFLSLKL